LDPNGATEQKHMIRELKNVLISNELRLQFIANKGAPILNGIEIIRSHQP
jgi:hypothetical protein